MHRPVRTMMFVTAAGALLSAGLASAAVGSPEADINQASPHLVEQVRSGKRTEANAAWWGFDPHDSTRCLQQAVRSGAKTLIVPNMGKPWLVGPVFLESNQEVVFEKGVVVQALKGSFLGLNDSLFTADDKENITLRGDGTEFVMWKEDYRKAPYRKGEWRMCLLLLSCRNIVVSGLRLKASGGDGIYVGRSNTKGTLPSCEDIEIKDVVCDDNYRQGISVTSAKNLLIEACTLQNTKGTAPGAGIDFEPNDEVDLMVNCIVRNCIMRSNMGGKWGGDGILIVGPKLNHPMSIRIENTTSENNKRAAVTIVPRGAIGQVDFVNCDLKGRIDAPQRDDLKVRFLDDGTGPAHKPDVK